ncbi:MAG: FtsX-like permease family protein [Candidatus Doudnabacteria bacterium]
MKRFIEFKNEWLSAIRVGWFLAFRQIRRSSKGTTLLIISIMVLTFLNLVVVSGLLVGLLSGSFKAFKDSWAADVIITPKSGRDYIENTPQLVNFIQNHPQTQKYSSRLGVNGQLLGTLDDNPAKDERVNSVGARVIGMDPAQEENLTQFSRFVIEGQPLRSGEEGYILIGANLIKEYSSFGDVDIPGLDLLRGVKVGDKVKLTVTDADGNTKSQILIVKGLVKSKVDEVSTRMFMLESELKRLLPVNQEEAQSIAVKLNNPDYAQKYVDQLAVFQGENQALIQTAEQAIPSFLRDIETTFNILGNALSSIALVVASITVFIVIFINAVTRRKFIGIMKGIGISPKAIQTSYIIQAVFYGLVGSAIGLILTFALLKPYFDANPIDFPFSDGILVATPLGSAIRVLILLAVTLAAGYLPAKLIVRKNTLDSILGR